MPEWQAAMVAPDDDFDGAPLLRTTFELDAPVRSVVAARLHLTAQGVCEAWLNESAVSHEVLAPGWSSYEWRLRYATHDVSQLLSEGTNVLGVALGNGWWRGRLGWTGKRHVYGDELAAWAQLEIEYADGSTQLVCTDETWRSGPSAVLSNDLYDGQSVDARLLDRSWLAPDTQLSPAWTGVHEVALDPAVLSPRIGPGVVRTEQLAAQRVWTSPSGRTLVDFGQNLVGWVRLTVTGDPGQEVVLRHAEVLEDGELGVRPLRTAEATDRYLLSGGTDVLEPTFTFHGFRYVEVTGWPGELDPGDLTAVVVGSDLRRTGGFRCSDDDLNQLHANVVWGLRGNFLDVPTDCPQRDERLGWTGDLSVFAPTAAYLFDVSDFLGDWLRDLEAEQRHHDGMVPFVVPDVLKHVTATGAPDEFPAPETTAVWSDAAVWVPWALWQAYGDPSVLADQLDSMLWHCRRIRSLLSETGLWDTGFQFGDWLDPQAPPDHPEQAQADTGVVATACAFRSATLTAQAAGVLGRTDEQAEMDELAQRLRGAFAAHYVDEDARVHSDCVTVYALAIAFGLLDPGQETRAGARLAELAAANDHRISTGFAGTPYVTEALTRTGQLDTAYRLLLEKECPSWLYPVTMGATTVWERWDSMLPDGRINPGEMTSFNHYALGAVADWLHRSVGGLAPAGPGYRRILVRPQPGGDLAWAESWLDTPYGMARVRWERDRDALVVDVEVPPGSDAVVVLPGQEQRTLGAGTHHLRSDLV